MKQTETQRCGRDIAPLPPAVMMRIPKPFIKDAPDEIFSNDKRRRGGSGFADFCHWPGCGG
ncbi:MAG: hypothetical protein Q8L93_03455 [Rhodocyclaceae bacterium]|nr:hypothetical protein [Rhodocyclaceae bacterium]